MDGCRQTLDEGLFHVLHGASLCLSSISDLLQSAAGTKDQEDAQLRLLQLQVGRGKHGVSTVSEMFIRFTDCLALLRFPSQSLSAELSALDSELACQGPKVSRVLGSECAQWCVDGVCRVLPVVRAALGGREKQLGRLQEESVRQQVRARARRHSRKCFNTSTCTLIFI